MKKLLFAALAAFIYLSLAATPVLANDTAVASRDSSYAQGPFQFYCSPQTSAFESGGQYTVDENGKCFFSIPQAITSVGGGLTDFALYKGTVGNSQIKSEYLSYPGATLMNTEATNFNSLQFVDSQPISVPPTLGDDFFAAVYPSGTDNLNFIGRTEAMQQFHDFFTAGSAPPNQNYQILRWKWGGYTTRRIDPVVIIPGILGSWEKNGQWILDPILHTYNNLVDTFLANGYAEGQTLFKFPYDWEQPNEVTAYQLKNKIAEIKTICNCSKVDLVGHSMGGLIAANYIERDDYANDVDQLFFVATPLSGAPKAYKAWEAGDIDFGGQSANIALGVHFNIEALQNGYTNIYDYIRNKPIVSIQELLPVRSNYLKTTNGILVYPTGYPQNGFLESIINNFYKISSRGVDVKTILADTNDSSTIGGFTVASSTKPGLWVDGQPIATTFVAGDGTVPRSSIEAVTPVDKEFSLTDHTGVASTSTQYLFKQTTGTEPSVIIGKKYNLFKSILYFKLFSPIDMQITAPDGKKLGKDFSTNIEISEIPDAFYSGFNTDNEYAVILNPLPGEYKINTIGTGSGGTYEIVANYADISTTSSVIVVGTSTPGITEPHTFIVAATSTIISLPPPPVATSTPTTTPVTPETCVKDITKAYQDHWIGKKSVYQRLVIDCKLLGTSLKARDAAKHPKVFKVIYAGIERVLANMDLLAKDKHNTQDGVLLITKITTWFKTHEL